LRTDNEWKIAAGLEGVASDGALEICGS
jgi:hypothetical protein